MSDCQPSNICPPTPAPVLPRCDVVLPDGTYANATIVVEDGCITDVQEGIAPLYQPTNCCAGGEGGTSGIDGLDGPPGPSGAAGTVAVGSVTSLAFGAAPTVTNSGTPTSAILNFGIPRGEDGTDGAAPSGLTNTTAGIQFTNGSLQGVPITWPPVLLVNNATSDTAGITLTFAKDGATGIVTPTLNVDPFVTALTADLSAQIGTEIAAFDPTAVAALNAVLMALETQIISLQAAYMSGVFGTALDLDGNGTDDAGGTPGVTPPPPYAHS